MGWNLVPDDNEDNGDQISTAPHRRTYDHDEHPWRKRVSLVSALSEPVSMLISPVVTASATFWKIPSNLLRHQKTRSTNNSALVYSNSPSPDYLFIYCLVINSEFPQTLRIVCCPFITPC